MAIDTEQRLVWLNVNNLGWNGNPLNSVGGYDVYDLFNGSQFLKFYTFDSFSNDTISLRTEIYSPLLNYTKIIAPVPFTVTVTSVITHQVNFTWVPYTTDTYSVILNESTVQSGLTGNTSTISYLVPSTTYVLQIHDITTNIYSEPISFTTQDLSPPHRLITSTTNGQFIISATLLPPLSTYIRMIAVENVRIVYKTSANPIESFVIRIDELSSDVVTFPYQSAITNYSAVIQSNTIGTAIVEPYNEPNISVYLQYVSSIDGQRHDVSNTYQCTASFVFYNYEA
jgi:hypothetical protein